MAFLPNPTLLVVFICLIGIAYNLGRGSQRKAYSQSQAQTQSNSPPAPPSKSSSSRPKTNRKIKKPISTKVESSEEIKEQLQDAIDTPLEGVFHHNYTTKLEKKRLEEGKKTKRTKRERGPKTEKIEPPWCLFRHFLEESGHADRIRSIAHRQRLAAMEKEQKREYRSKAEKIESTLSPMIQFLEESGHADRIRAIARRKRVAAVEQKRQLQEEDKQMESQEEKLEKKAPTMEIVEVTCGESEDGKTKAFGKKKRETVTKWRDCVKHTGELSELDLGALEVVKVEDFWRRKRSKRVETRYREVELKRLY